MELAVDNPEARRRLAVLPAILIGATMLRGAGVGFGLPLATHPDEPFLLVPAMRMVATGDLNPHFFNYPALYTYAQAALLTLTHQASRAAGLGGTVYDVPLPAILTLGRALTVLVSMATVVVAFRIGRRIVPFRFATVGLALAAVSPLALASSHSITVDAATALFGALAVLFAVRLEEDGPEGGTRHREAALGGLSVGLAASCKYTGLLAAAPVTIACLATRRRGDRRLPGHLLLAGVTAAAAFVAANPFILVDTASFLGGLYAEAAHYSSGHPGADSGPLASSYGYYLSVLTSRAVGPLGAVLAAIGALSLARRDGWLGATLLSYPAVQILMVGRYTVHFERNLLPVVVPVAVLAAVGTEVVGNGVAGIIRRRWSTGFRRRGPSPRAGAAATVSAAALGLLATLTPLADSVELIDDARGADTRVQAIRWIDAHLPPGSVVAREQYTPPLDGRRFQVRSLGYYGLLTLTPEELAETDYLVASSGDYARFLQSPGRYPSASARYREIFSNHRLVREFRPGRDTRGPVIRILRVDPARTVPFDPATVVREVGLERALSPFRAPPHPDDLLWTTSALVLPTGGGSPATASVRLPDPVILRRPDRTQLTLGYFATAPARLDLRVGKHLVARREALAGAGKIQLPVDLDDWDDPAPARLHVSATGSGGGDPVVLLSARLVGLASRGADASFPSGPARP